MFPTFDAAATAPLRPEALAAMLPVFEAMVSGEVANPSSVHGPGFRAGDLVSQARERIAVAFGARTDEVVFTSGGTEANNLAILGIARANPRGKHLVTTSLEHPSVIETIRYLERVDGYEVTLLAVDETGVVSVEEVRRVLRADTTLLSVGLANGEIGTVQPLSEISACAQALGVAVHTDAVQAAATLPVSFLPDAWPGAVSAMSIASHKFGGPQGAGALLLRGGLPLEPHLHGGGQEFGLRSGTHNVAAIAGFAAAVTAARAQVGTAAMQLVHFRDQLIRRVLTEVPGAALTGQATERLPGHASFVVAGVSGESMLVALDAAGIAASSGSACAAGKDEPSPALLAIGIAPYLAHTAIRFSMVTPPLPEVGDKLIERVVQVLIAETQRVRLLSI